MHEKLVQNGLIISTRKIVLTVLVRLSY